MIRCRFCHGHVMEYKGDIHLKFGDRDEKLPQWHCKNEDCTAHDSAHTYYPWHVVCEIDYTDKSKHRYTFAGIVHAETEQEAVQTVFDDFEFFNSHTDVIKFNMKTFIVNHIDRSNVI